MHKQNCWEFKDCGRQPGGKHDKDNGICPASVETKLDSVHGGKNAGRACWVIAKTLCHDAVQGSFANKHKNCPSCDFYHLVEEEEGQALLSIKLLKKMKFG